ncbi:hypothetical protein BN133_3865 [Cronobacter dublinensis 582]|nr:hypothetical protein BN133_3865 [Cronobacter dublinensis 582]
MPAKARVGKKSACAASTINAMPAARHPAASGVFTGVRSTRYRSSSV